MESPRTLVLSDGRWLAWEEAGDPDGAPILYFHGSPGSRLQRRVFIRGSGLCDMQVYKISPDRPGHGWSDFQVDRSIEDWPNDVAAFADYLRLKRFAVLGFSGGTPYTLAVGSHKV
jgi:pimeloyl-ACP methyl ester carboxylesterase